MSEIVSNEKLVRELEEKAKFIRLETVRLIDIAKSGHYTSVFSCAELFSVLYYHVMSVDPNNPDWEDRDRFVLSKGHAAVGLYPVLADHGFFPKEWLDSYTRVGSAFGDHPDMRKIPGIDFSSGSLGQGLSVSTGMAIGGNMSNKDYKVYCMLGDGELNEGQIWEAILSAANLKLNNLVAIVDRNQMSLDGFTEDIMPVNPIDQKFEAFGWETRHVDGHNLTELVELFDEISSTKREKPLVIIADTLKGKGVEGMELNNDWHLGYLAEKDRKKVEEEIHRGLQSRT
ncbi:transketolase [Alteribacillus bidgolensis]|uniref:Transketolase n=1 Tax=Alteribacillus bidgolensis TaxID=930129 RepID=A0A1G8I5A1_9BACI|nr:transketolase [Alteribacillus bidgolensis]SDI14004.1 transketolase [Alteribacillus bidgolensis]